MDPLQLKRDAWGLSDRPQSHIIKAHQHVEVCKFNFIRPERVLKMCVSILTKKYQATLKKNGENQLCCYILFQRVWKYLCNADISEWKLVSFMYLEL